MSEPIQMSDPLTVIFVERPSGDRTICGTIATSIPKRNHSNVMTAAKVFVNQEHWQFTRSFTWRTPLTNALPVESLSIR
jgi:hypothetical protein